MVGGEISIDFENEATARRYRVREAAMDIGAFESTTTGKFQWEFPELPEVEFFHFCLN